MTMHGDREGANALLRSAPGALLEATPGGSCEDLFNCGTIWVFPKIGHPF